MARSDKDAGTPEEAIEMLKADHQREHSASLSSQNAGLPFLFSLNVIDSRVITAPLSVRQYR